MSRRLVLAMGMLLSFVSISTADEIAYDQQWPRWRGPLANGVAPHANPPLTWSETKNVRWKVEIPGEGSSTPIIWGDRIFLLTAIKTDRKSETAPPAVPTPEAGPRRGRGGGDAPTNVFQFVVLCLDRQTGKTLWQQVATEQTPHEGVHPDNDFASFSPITNGKHLYASFGSRGVYCYDLDGKQVWQRELAKLKTRNGFGEGSSPALDGNTLVTVWDQEESSFIEALDATTGKTLWKKDRDEVTSWATPLIIEHDGRKQAIVNASTRVRSYDLKTGDVIWECGGQVTNVTPSPVANDKLVYCMSGFRGNALFALPFDQQGDLTDTDKVAWQHKRGTPYVPSPLLYGDRLFFNQSNDGILTCMNATDGKILIDRTRMPSIARMYASPVGAAEHVYFVSRDGKALVIKNSDTFEVLAENSLDEEFDASPAVVGDELFLRGKKYLYCLKEEGK